MLIALPITRQEREDTVNTAYIRYIKKSGYEPILTTMDNRVTTIAEMCNGLLLPGGGDLHPCYYEENNVASYACNLEKDNYERELFYAFTKLGKPVFGICRGFQLVIRELMLHNNDAELILDYHQHIDYHNQNNLKLDRNVPVHSVKITGGLYNEEMAPGTVKRIFVNSFHHQGVTIKKAILLGKSKTPGVEIPEGIRITAFTDYGSTDTKGTTTVIEGMNIHRKFFGGPIKIVQWHPEEMEDHILLKSFFDNIKKPTAPPIREAANGSQG